MLSRIAKPTGLQPSDLQAEPDNSFKPTQALAAIEQLMQDLLNFPIRAANALSTVALGRGFSVFNQLAEHVRALPYGRVSSNADPLAVLLEERGTCSSKHQLLAAVAHECGHTEVQLIVGIYEMCEQNTPGVGEVLRTASYSCIPEAHCYLMVADNRFDFTGLAAGTQSPFKSLLEEHVVSPKDLWQMKPRLHIQALETWAVTVGTTAVKAWATREACIAALAANNSLQADAASRHGLTPTT